MAPRHHRHLFSIQERTRTPMALSCRTHPTRARLDRLTRLPRRQNRSDCRRSRAKFYIQTVWCQSIGRQTKLEVLDLGRALRLCARNHGFGAARAREVPGNVIVDHSRSATYCVEVIEHGAPAAAPRSLGSIARS